MQHRFTSVDRALVRSSGLVTLACAFCQSIKTFHQSLPLAPPSPPLPPPPSSHASVNRSTKKWKSATICVALNAKKAITSSLCAFSTHASPQMETCGCITASHQPWPAPPPFLHHRRSCPPPSPLHLLTASPSPSPPQTGLTCIYQQVNKEVEERHHLCCIEHKESDDQPPPPLQQAHCRSFQEGGLSPPFSPQQHPPPRKDNTTHVRLSAGQQRSGRGPPSVLHRMQRCRHPLLVLMPPPLHHQSPPTHTSTAPLPAQTPIPT
jgi:hypothetical protein